MTGGELVWQPPLLGRGIFSLSTSPHVGFFEFPSTKNVKTITPQGHLTTARPLRKATAPQATRFQQHVLRKCSLIPPLHPPPTKADLSASSMFFTGLVKVHSDSRSTHKTK